MEVESVILEKFDKCFQRVQSLLRQTDVHWDVVEKARKWMKCMMFFCQTLPLMHLPCVLLNWQVC